MRGNLLHFLPKLNDTKQYNYNPVYNQPANIEKAPKTKHTNKEPTKHHTIHHNKALVAYIAKQIKWFDSSHLDCRENFCFLSSSLTTLDVDAKKNDGSSFCRRGASRLVNCLTRLWVWPPTACHLTGRLRVGRENFSKEKRR